MKAPKENAADVINWLLWLLGIKLKESPPPIPPPVPVPDDIEWDVMDHHNWVKEFREANLVGHSPRDSWFWYPKDRATWIKWCDEARAEAPPYNQPTETERGWDCDDSADWFDAWCKARHMANAITHVWGMTPQGRHAWNIVQIESGKWEFEPQTSECWLFGTNPDYKAEERL